MCRVRRDKTYVRGTCFCTSLLVHIRQNDDFLMTIVPVAITDVNPTGLHDELVVGEVVTDEHISLGHELGRNTDVGGFASLVLAVTDATHEGIDTGLAVATIDVHWTANVLPKGFKDMFTEQSQVFNDFLWWFVVQPISLGSGRASELRKGEMFC